MATKDLSSLEKRLWATADELRANSKLKSAEYSVPVLGLIFLRYADQKFAAAEKQITRFQAILKLPEGQNIGEFFTPTAIVEIIEPFHGRLSELGGRRARVGTNFFYTVTSPVCCG